MSDQTIFGLSCPSGGPFYACDYGTRFLGCCTRGGVDVCANGCELDSLQAANFDQQYYSNITQNDCNTTIRAGEWYTCEDTAPPFLGCCASNACMYTGGCPDDQLVPAQLSENETEIAPFLPILMRQTTATKPRTSAIIGGVVGGVVFAILIGFVVWYRIRKLRKHVIQQSNPKDDNKDLIISESPTTFPLSPAPIYNGPMDIKSTPPRPHELHSESASIAEIASSDVPLSVPGPSALDPASLSQVHPRGSTPNTSGFRPYTTSEDQLSRTPGTSFGLGTPDNLATNF